MTRRLGLIALAGLLAATVSVPAAAGGELDSELSGVQKRISALQSQIDASTAERSGIARKLLAVGDRLESAEIAATAAKASSDRLDDKILESEAALLVVRTELADRFVQLTETRAKRDAARQEAESWAKQAYMGGGSAQPDIAFSASAIVDVSVGVAYLDVLTSFSASTADRYSSIVATEELEEDLVRRLEIDVVREVEDLVSTKAEFEEAAATSAAASETLAAELADHQALLDAVDQAVEEFEGELASLSREQASIRGKIAAAAAASAPKDPAPTVVSVQPPRRSGKLLRPVPGEIESGFGPRVHPITGKTRMHTGLDMHGDAGTPIRAAEDGKVIFSGIKGGYGKAIMIDHGGGMVTLYAHQSKLLVKEGQRVTAGDVIGLVGSTGLSTGPHLHFEVRINGNPVDAEKYL